MVVAGWSGGGYCVPRGSCPSAGATRVKVDRASGLPPYRLCRHGGCTDAIRQHIAGPTCDSAWCGDFRHAGSHDKTDTSKSGYGANLLVALRRAPDKRLLLCFAAGDKRGVVNRCACSSAYPGRQARHLLDVRSSRRVGLAPGGCSGDSCLPVFSASRLLTQAALRSLTFPGAMISLATRLPDCTAPFMKPAKSPLVCSPAKRRRPPNSGVGAA